MGMFSARVSSQVSPARSSPVSPDARHGGLFAPVLFGVGGLALGAAFILVLSPDRESQLRSFLRHLLRWGEGQERGAPAAKDSIDEQLAAMENEGGVLHEPSAGSGPGSRATSQA